MTDLLFILSISIILIAIISFFVYKYILCENKCSPHGKCDKKGKCKCGNKLIRINVR